MRSRQKGVMNSLFIFLHLKLVCRGLGLALSTFADFTNLLGTGSMSKITMYNVTNKITAQQSIINCVTLSGDLAFLSLVGHIRYFFVQPNIV